MARKCENCIHDKVCCEWAVGIGMPFVNPDTCQHYTADVVPKSEADDLRRYIILNEDIAIKCKRENGEQNEEYWKGKISAFRQIRAYIDAELKKKYTESEGERYKYAERNRCNE